MGGGGRSAPHVLLKNGIEPGTQGGPSFYFEAMHQDLRRPAATRGFLKFDPIDRPKALGLQGAVLFSE